MLAFFNYRHIVSLSTKQVENVTNREVFSDLIKANLICERSIDVSQIIKGVYGITFEQIESLYVEALQVNMNVK